MGGGVSPLVRGRRLAAALRQLRAEAGRTVEEVAVHLECSAAKISRIENGLVGVRIQDARELLDLYGVRGEAREQLLELLRQARGKVWWQPYADLMPEGFDRFMAFEEEATVIWMLESRLVPGLLQTGQYATALMATRRDNPPELIDRLVAFRLGRQRILTDTDPPAMHILLDEAVLRRRMGSGAVVMAGQYRRLAAEARTANVSLRVIPLDSAPHQAPGYSFTIFGFADPADPKVVFEELLEGTAFHESAETAGRYIAAFEQARGCALGEAETVDLLDRLAGESG